MQLRKEVFMKRKKGSEQASQERQKYVLLMLRHDMIEAAAAQTLLMQRFTVSNINRRFKLWKSYGVIGKRVRQSVSNRTLHILHIYLRKGCFVLMHAIVA